MELLPQSHEIKDALQKRDIEDLAREIHDGFKGIHDRQDEANHQTAKNTADIISLQNWNEKQVIRDKYNHFIWYLLTVSITVIVALGSYILYHKQ